MTVRSRQNGRQRRYCFVCASYDSQGTTVCGNGLLLPMRAADEAIIAAVARLLDAEIVEGAIRDAVEALRPDEGALKARRAALREELETIDAEQARVAEGIAAAGHVESLVASLREREQRRLRLHADLAALDGADHLATFDGPRVARELRCRVDEWRGLVRRQTPIGRQGARPAARRSDRVDAPPRAGRVPLSRPPAVCLLSGIVPTDGRPGLRKVWRARQDSNLWPSAPEADALSS
jgi:hypothetical protein